MIDLHTHTDHSDGELTPEQLIRRAAERGVTTLAITDHDTVEAYSAHLSAFALTHGIDLVPGIELSTTDQQTQEKVHVLGLDIDTDNQELTATCKELQRDREQNMIEVAAKLMPLGLILRTDQLLASGEIITKAHIASDILENPDNHATLIARYDTLPMQGTLIEDLLIRTKPAFVARNRQLMTHEAVELVKRANGRAICAHPSFNVMRGLSFQAMKDLIARNNFDGVEALNVQYNKSDNDQRFDMVAEFSAFAQDANLLISGGSDYHSDDRELWGNHTELGLANEPYAVTTEHLNAITREGGAT